MIKFSLLICTLFAATSHISASDWQPLFNGKDLSGWTVKVAKHPVGENFANAWQVDEGILKVDFSGYENFNMQVSHLYTDIPYSFYRLRLDYKFVEGHREDAPHWIAFNSGVMLHSQSPQSMEKEQAFPVSIEAQFLSTGATAGTQTANVVTPGTHIVKNGNLTKDHIIDSTSRLFPIGEWVHFEAVVRGDEEMIYFINGEEVNRFQNPQLDPEDQDAKALIESGATIPLFQGHIALQAEGQNIWFRNVEIVPLPAELPAD